MFPLRISITTTATAITTFGLFRIIKFYDSMIFAVISIKHLIRIWLLTFICLLTSGYPINVWRVGTRLYPGKPFALCRCEFTELDSLISSVRVWAFYDFTWVGACRLRRIFLSERLDLKCIALNHNPWNPLKGNVFGSKKLLIFIFYAAQIITQPKNYYEAQKPPMLN